LRQETRFPVILRTDPKIFSTEIAENTNRPTIEELKDCQLLGTSAAFSLSAAGRLSSTEPSF